MDNDNLNGEGGSDVVDYSDATAKVTVRLWNSTVADAAAGDTIAGFEGAIGGSAGDALVGADAVANFLSGGAGNDLIAGKTGDDTIRGGSGADNLNGEGGTDTLDYTDATAKVTVRLWNSTATDDIATGDVIASFEHVLGGSGNDAIVGADGVANRIAGNAGNDNLQGRSGNDTLLGGAGNDTMTGGADADTFEFGAGNGIDRVEDFQAGAAVSDVVRLVGLGAAFDSFAEIMAVTSQSGANAVIDFGGGNTITLLNVTVANLVANDFSFG